MLRRWFLLLALLLVSGTAHAEKRIALSFDDAPRSSGAFFSPDQRTRRIIAQLKMARVRQAAFFVVPGQIGSGDGAGGERRIMDYVRAGHVIANHSFSHQHLSQTPADAYLADLDKAQAWLNGRKGTRPWFRFPFLDEGGADKAKRDAVRAGLAARGLRNGYVTAESADWNLDALTRDAMRAGKRVDRRALGRLFVDWHVGAADFADALMLKAIGRSPAHVLLLHETDLAALYIADLVKALRADGWTIISADEAYADPLASARPEVPYANGTLTEALAWERGLPKPRWYQFNDTGLAAREFRKTVLGESPEQ